MSNRLSEHSITFGTLNSYTDLGLISKKATVVSYPEPKTDLREITGMSGKLDYTHVLSEKTFYKNRTGAWEFLAIGNYIETWKKVYSVLHGKNFYVYLDDDPEYAYYGRVTVEEPSSNGIKTTIKIDYDLKPEKSVNPLSPALQPKKAIRRMTRRRNAPIKKTYTGQGLPAYIRDGQFTVENPTTKNFDWKWDDLFDNVIYYGNFHVEGEKWRNFINTGTLEVIPTFTLSAEMDIEFSGVTYHMIKGETTDYALQLQPGDNILHFTGTGDVNVDYRVGVTL